MNNFLGSGSIKVGRDFAELSRQAGYGIEESFIEEEVLTPPQNSEDLFAIRRDPIYLYPARNGNKSDPLRLALNSDWSADPLAACEAIAQKCADTGIKRCQINHPDGDIVLEIDGELVDTLERQPNEYQRLAYRDPNRLKDILKGFELILQVVDELSIYTGCGFIPESQQKFMVSDIYFLDAREPKQAKRMADQYRPWIDAGVTKIGIDNSGSTGAGPAGPKIYIEALQEELGVPIQQEALAYRNIFWKDNLPELTVRGVHNIDSDWKSEAEIEAILDTCPFAWVIFETFIDRLYAASDGPAESFGPRTPLHIADAYKKRARQGRAEICLYMQPINELAYHFSADANNDLTIPIPEDMKNPYMAPLGDMKDLTNPAVIEMFYMMTKLGYCLMANSTESLELCRRAYDDVYGKQSVIDSIT